MFLVMNSSILLPKRQKQCACPKIQFSPRYIKMITIPLDNDVSGTRVVLPSTKNPGGGGDLETTYLPTYIYSYNAVVTGRMVAC